MTKCPLIYAPNEPNPDHLTRVTRTMQRRGRPVIRAFWDGRRWLALEGSHRLAACRDLGLTPKIKPLYPKQRLRHDFGPEVGSRVADILDYYKRMGIGPGYKFKGITAPAAGAKGAA